MARISITKEFKFSMGHALWDYDGKCANLHGHNYRCQITVSAAGDLTPEGFVMDFGDIKTHIANYVDEHWDHKTLVNKDDVRFEDLSIDTGVIPVPWNPTAENLSIALFTAAQGILEEKFSVKVESIELWETDTGAAIVSRR